jgi:hypothetical protein
MRIFPFRCLSLSLGGFARWNREELLAGSKRDDKAKASWRARERVVDAGEVRVAQRGRGRGGAVDRHGAHSEEGERSHEAGRGSERDASPVFFF